MVVNMEEWNDRYFVRKTWVDRVLLQTNMDADMQT